MLMRNVLLLYTVWSSYISTSYRTSHHVLYQGKKEVLIDYCALYLVYNELNLPYFIGTQKRGEKVIYRMRQKELADLGS